VQSTIDDIKTIFTKDSEYFYPTNDDWLDFVSSSLQDIKVIIQNRVYIIEVTKLHKFDSYIVVLYDITTEVEHEQDLQKLLYTDLLTKFPNRKALIEDLRKDELDIKSLAIIDINDFKEINDFYGNKVGDYILKGVADLIQDKIKFYQNMRLYKFPSDIYCISNSSSNEYEFKDVIKNIVEDINEKVFIGDTFEIDTRATAGISFSPKNNKLITADLALQAAKANHQLYIIFYEELDNLREYKNNMEWAKKLKIALAKDNIVVHYQPLVNNHTLKVDKYECLVRMIDDDDKVISPFFFLDVSKKSNQYIKITKRVIKKAFKEFEKLPFEFSVNVSYDDISEKDFLPFVKEQVELFNVANKVVFEILEDEGIKNYDILINFINEVKAMGCKVAIDDFGSGYSNFEHLLKMKIDYLKIDASLIKNIVKDENSYKITKTIIEFAKSLNLKTIAEYVENKEIFESITKLGATYSQGYFFSAPVAKPTMSSYKGFIDESRK
jgi:diguanylate cyclase (GGDEF)-like protein